jgi:excisionase family DNA binding protein
MSELLSCKEFAKRLGVTEACVRRWLLRRSINSVKVGNRLIQKESKPALLATPVASEPIDPE